MNKLEENFLFNKSHSEAMKKHSKQQSIRCFEDFSNEIFYDLFEYFNGYEIVQTFSYLSYRFQQLLNSSTILIKTHFYLFNLNKFLFTNNKISSTELCSKSNLKILSISYSNDRKLLDANRWEQFLSYYYPELEKFYMTYSQYVDNRLNSSCFELDQFSSSFWIERKWLFKIIIDKKNINYIIYPYRKTSNEIFQHENIDSSSSNYLFLMNSYNSLNFWVENDLSCVVYHVHIYHVEISMKQIPFQKLLLILRCLTHLLTLKIHSFQLDQNMTQLIKKCDDIMFFNIRKECLIKSLYIEEADDWDQLTYLFRLCRMIKCLEIKRFIKKNIEIFSEEFFYLIDRNVFACRSLTFHIPIINNEIIQKLDSVIHSKIFSDKYTVKRRNKKINIQYKQ
ncbi:hypothetical protein I4U23_026386 [Adineta vaga]|nr:hypothetical protein I4U23_026386 [Adineta vaga]